MKPAPFAYARARSVAHAIDLLAQDEARLLAGGQSLIATLNMRLDRPALLVDINGVPGLDGIARKNGHVEIGALVRHAQAECSIEVARHAPLIALAMPHIGHPAIRNRGTIGGSIAFADPAAELPACLIALGGEMEIVGPQGRRTVKADDFFTALFETALAPRDVLTLIRIPAASAATRIGFAEFARRHGDYAMVGLAACARADGRSLSDIRLAYFGVGPIPVRARNAETALSSGDLDGALAALTTDLDPSDDVQATAAVKTHLAGVLLRRVAKQLMAALVLPEIDRLGAGRLGAGRLGAGRLGAGRLGAAGPGATAMSERFYDIALDVNGDCVCERVDARTTLVDFLREKLSLTGSHVGCEHGVCGACTVRVNGVVVRGCLILAVQCDGMRVETIEGVSATHEIADLQQAFIERNALQCGYCTPGMLLTAQELLTAGGIASRAAIRTHLSGNYCRCTGYQAIVDAVEAVAQARAGAER